MRLEKKEIFLLIPATLLALAGFGVDDPWIVGPFLTLSWIAFLLICLVHDGSHAPRIIFAVTITVVFSLLGVRLYYHHLKQPERREEALRMSEEPTAHGPKLPIPENQATSSIAALNNTQKPISCRVTAIATSEVVARLYMRGMAPPLATTVSYSPFFQELFYEWSLELSANRSVSGIRIIIRDDLQPNDRVRVAPDGAAVVSEPASKWLSGFNEPSKAPDYYVRTILVSSLKKGTATTITFRRPIRLPSKSNKMSEADFARSFAVESPQCVVDKRAPDAHEQALRIFAHLGILGSWRYSGPDKPPLQVKRDPDSPEPPLAPGEVEATAEARCKDVLCKEIIMGQLEARRGTER